MLIRDATAGDVPAILEIYNEQVLHGTATFDTEPKTGADHGPWFTRHDRERYPILVAEEGGAGGAGGGMVVGWARLYPWSDRCAYARSAENSVYVQKEWRGRGVARALMTELLARARARGIGVILARIAEGNPASIRLHENLGFERIGTMRRVGEKFARVLDVELMQLHLDGWGDGGRAGAE
jgi:phosphinothricin acetyltransferase